MNEIQSIYEGYLWGYLIMISIPVGALGIRLIHALTSGKWGEPLKPYCVAACRLWPLAMVLIVPLMFGFSHLYKWDLQGSMIPDKHLVAKQFYLNAPCMLIRTLLYFAVWIGSSFWLDRFNDRWNLSGLLGVLYVIAGTFAGIDWVMSLDPYWSSTVFGLVWIVGQVLLAFCLIVCLEIRKAPLQTSVVILRDQGNLILMLVMLWAYLAFCQYLIIWMGNLPEEIRWYLVRVKGGWGVVAWSLIIGHFLIPFLLLLRRSWKENHKSLWVIAILIIGMRIVDIAWMIFPSLDRSLMKISLSHVVGALGAVGVYGFFFVQRLKGVSNEYRT